MEKEFHLQRFPLPEGFEVFEDALLVAGVAYRRENVIEFIRGRDRSLDFEAEPPGSKFPDAIRVVGCTRGTFGPQRRHLGYVPAEVAEKINRGGLRGQVRPRLWKTYIGDDGYVEVGFQLLGPAGRQSDYNNDDPRYYIETIRGVPYAHVLYPRLRKHRVISGNSRDILERLAQNQLADWAKLEAEKERARQRKAERVSGLEAAAERTKEAQQAIAEAEGILAHTLTIDDAIDWDQLKDRTPFDRPRPQLPPLPPEPRPDDEAYRPKAGLMGLVSRSLREQREAAARARFEADHAAWASAREQSLAEHHQRMLEWQSAQQAFLAEQEARNSAVEQRRRQYLSRDPAAIVDYCNLVLAKSEYPEWLSPGFDVDYLPDGDHGTLIVDYHLPAVDTVPKVKAVKWSSKEGELKEELLSNLQAGRLYDSVVYQIALRTIHELFEADRAGALESVVFNGWAPTVDPATGQDTRICILSLQATKKVFAGLNLARVDPKECVRNLKAKGRAKLHSLIPIVPIMEINREDRPFAEQEA